jgi:hypothetical protein
MIKVNNNSNFCGDEKMEMNIANAAVKMITRKKKDTFNIQNWASERTVEIKEEINQHINEGLKVDKAIDMVLNESTLSNGIKGQIRQDILRQSKGFLGSCGLTFGVVV